MEEFEIEYLRTLYTVKPQENGDFIIYQGANYLGSLEATVGDDTFVKWVTADLMSLELAQRLGELIENKQA